MIYKKKRVFDESKDPSVHITGIVVIVLN